MTEPVAARAGISPASPLHDLLNADRATLLRAQDRVRRLRRAQGTLPEAPQGALRSLDPIPHLLSPPEWAVLESGLAQRARLLDLLLADVYGPRALVAGGVLPAEAVYGNPGFLRSYAGVPVPRRLVVTAFDLARAPDGSWRVLADRASVPRGLGAMLSTRRVLARLHPELYRELRVQRVDGFFDTLRSTLAGLADVPDGGSTRTVILSPGPDLIAFPEHTYLARHLGYTLVSGTDLTVRGGRVAVRSVGGLEPADVVLRLVDDAWCDPLELRPDSLLGPPGLIEATRRGGVSLANALGSGFLEHPALAAFLPAVSRALLGEDLLLAGGDRTGSGPGAAGTVPVVHDGRLVDGHLELRCFAVADGAAWNVLPGGLGQVRLERPGGPEPVVRKDVWALAAGRHRLVGPILTLPQIDLGTSLPSRNAEALYWMGRHAEAAETAIRMDQNINAELAATPELATDAGGAWVAMFSAAKPNGLEEALAALLDASLSARELLSTHMGQVLANLEDRLEALRSATSAGEIEEISGSALINLMALAGLSAESMVRDPGYLMGDIGRRLERGRLLVRVLTETLVPVPDPDIAGLTHETLLACCESLVAYRRRYRSDIEIEALTSLLVTDQSNPRSLAFQADRLLGDLRRLPGEPPEGALQPLGTILERVLVADLRRLLAPAGDRRPGLQVWLEGTGEDLERVAAAINLNYFAHVPVQPVGS